MRALIDVKEMTAVGTGLSRYEREVARRVTAASSATSIVRRRAVDDGSAGALTGGLMVVPDWLPSTVVEQVLVPLAAWRRRPDVVHSLAGMAPVMPVPARLVITFHEDRREYYRHHPPSGFYARVAAKWHVWSGVLALRRASCILTVSQTSADVVRGLVNRPATEIVAVPHGVSEAFRFTAPVEAAEPFVLTLASGDPRDDLAFALEGLAPMAATVRLVVAGRIPDSCREPILKEAAAAGVDVTFTGRISDAALADLYHRCLCYLHASLFEGFGLAVAEAMACGAVVIGRPSAAFEEVAGSDGVTVSSARALTAMLRSLLEDPAGRRSLGAAGIARAARFDWDPVFRRIMASYA